MIQARSKSVVGSINDLREQPWLAFLVVAIALTLRKRKDTKYQNPGEQISVRRQDRVRLVSMPSERSAGRE